MLYILPLINTFLIVLEIGRISPLETLFYNDDVSHCILVYNQGTVSIESRPWPEATEEHR